MYKSTQNMGICVTCNNRPVCLSFQNSLRANRPIWNCEEFDDFVPGMESDFANIKKKSFFKKPNYNDDIIPGRTMGLCINCGNRKTCMLPSPAGGIWHCEEYI
ncbi:MAG: hypothetical protein JRD71_01135 [Deltaproteobacteria bacterium]|nr:hypothetical protein [Deltaproteobacteria bacterium]